MFSIAVQRKVNANGGIITLRDLRDLAVSAKTDCYHVVDAADDTQLGRFYAENEFVPELDGISDEVFEMLDFAGIGRMMRCSENGVFAPCPDFGGDVVERADAPLMRPAGDLHVETGVVHQNQDVGGMAARSSRQARICRRIVPRLAMTCTIPKKEVSR